MTRAVLLMTAVLGVASPVQADITLTSGSMSVVLASADNWTVQTMTWNSYLLMKEPSSEQGTVLSIDGVWAGSGHGNETLLSTSITVDGIQHPIEDGATYTGKSIQLSRTSNLGGAYRLTSLLKVNEAATCERVTLDGLDASKSIDEGNAYVFLGTRSSGLKDYAAYSADRAVLFSGTSNGDNSFTHLKPAVAVAQYDPISQIGVVSQITEGVEHGLNPFIWNRGYDFKLYVDVVDVEGTAATTKHFMMCQTLMPFQAAPGNWIATAGALVAPEPGSLSLSIAGLIGISPCTWKWGRRHWILGTVKSRRTCKGI